MGTYNLPRSVKGEGRILFIFSTKSLIYTGILGGVGVLFFALFNAIGLTIVGVVIFAILALLGFIIGTFKIPEITTIEFTKKTSGEAIDDVIKRAFLFKMKKRKVYTLKEDTKDDWWY